MQIFFLKIGLDLRIQNNSMRKNYPSGKQPVMYLQLNKIPRFLLFPTFILMALLFFSFQSKAQISGRVTDDQGVALEGVSVTASGTRAGTSTDQDGKYSLNVPSGTKSLQFTLVGYVNQTASINGRNVIDIMMQLSTKSLDEVVITGYSTTTRKQSPTAATTISADKINQVPMTIDQALQGRVPGLIVSSGSGQPGASAKMTIRGVGTINGSTSVLYVIDGIPVENGYFQTINPTDIESMTTLKDASAKALYGSRGSNGVIVVTTKKGKAGSLNFGYKSQYGFSDLPTPTFKMMNAEEHLRFEEELGLEANYNAGPGWTYSPKNPKNANKSAEELARNAAILDSLKKVNTDWRDFFFQKGSFMEQQIDASGGNESVQFYSSLNYYDQQGIAVRSGMKRITLRNNVNFKKDRFFGNINTSIGYSNSSFINSEGSSSGNNPLSAVYYALPYEYPYYPGGILVHSGNTKQYPVLDQREGSNAYERLLNTTNKTNQLKTILSGALNYELFDGLVIKTQAGIDMRQSLDEAWVNPDSYSGSKVSNGKKGSFDEASRRNFSFISTSGATYSKKWGSVHDVSVTGLFEYLYDNYRSFGYTGFGLDGRLPNTPAGISQGSATAGFIPVISGSRIQNATASIISFARYTYDGKYTLNLSWRNDGSTSVPEGNRWHQFYSVGANWEAGREEFIKNIDWLSDLRFRASYGTTASPLYGYKYAALYGLTTYAGVTGIRPTTPGNADYNWEFAKETNIGTDIGLFTNRVRIVADIYKRITSNLFFEKPLSITSGFSGLDINGGSVENKGLELDLQIDVIRNANLTWTVGGNIAFNKNKVLDLDGEDEFEIGYTGIIRVGLPLGSHYAPEFAGIDPQTGNPTYIDPATGEKTTNYNFTTQSVAKFGSYNPGHSGGINSSLSYKGISLGVLFSFVGDVVRYNNEMYYNENSSFVTSNQTIRMLEDRWKKPGDNAILSRFGAKRNFSSFDFYDASYIRLRNVTLGYQLPAPLLAKTKVFKSVRVFVQGENLYTWTKWIGFDPENGNEYNRFAFPNPRTYTAGLNINF